MSFVNLQDNYNIVNEILQDIRIRKYRKKDKKLKVQPWAEHKENSRLLWQSYLRLHEEKRAWNIFHCGSDLDFKECKENTNSQHDHYKHLVHANFCRSRLCPMCNWRKSLVTYTQMQKIVGVAEGRKKMRYIHLVLTVKNVPSSRLSDEITSILEGYKTLFKRKRVKDISVGVFRALEVTFDSEEFITKEMYRKKWEYFNKLGLKVGDLNPTYNTYHPHIHVLIAVDPSYFAKDGQAYIHHSEWVQLWKDSMGLDYDPNVEVKAVKDQRNIEKAIAELSKYTVKPEDYIFKNNKALTDRVVCTLDHALKGRRLVSFGGLFKEIRKELNLEEVDQADLTHVGEDLKQEVCPKCGCELVERSYAWDKNIKQYKLHDVSEVVNFKLLELVDDALGKDKYSRFRRKGHG